MSVTVNFHLHSSFSDGEQSPEALVAKIYAAGVGFCSLTDHDSIEGLTKFQKAAEKHEIACLPGVELTTWFKGRELHLLGYGFDPGYPDLQTTLVSLRQAKELEVQSITNAIRKKGINQPGVSNDRSNFNSAPNGRLDTAEAIDLLHRAGGKVFLAHPFMYDSDPSRVGLLIGELQALGLDGLEAYYGLYSSEQQKNLVEIAKNHSMPVCAGTDLHTTNGVAAVEMPDQHWVQFRQILFTSPMLDGQSADSSKENSVDKPLSSVTAKPHHFRRRSYIVRIFLPTLIAIGLFLAVIWGIILPTYEQTLLDRKRELIRELTNSAMSILASYERDEKNGLLTREQAQAQAAAMVEAMRYGEEGKDYFWIQDLQPRMVMHPYRSDLNGMDMSRFTDPRGVAIFVEFANKVKREGEGYLDYVWQWKDDSSRLEPKESYVKGFGPWGWVIGTGIYTDDVRAEISRLEQNLVQVSLLISGAVVFLLAFVLHQSLKIERERQEFLDDLQESTERYHSLVEATTEGTLLIIDKRCRFANQTFLGMSGYSKKQLGFLELSDLFPRVENNDLWEKLDLKNEGGTGEVKTFEGVLTCADGSSLDCILGISPIQFAGQTGLILLCRDVTSQPYQKGSETLGRVAQNSPLGIFQAMASKQAAILECNQAAREFFSKPHPVIADLFPDPVEFEDVYHKLMKGVVIQNHVLQIETTKWGLRYVSLSIRLVSEDGENYFIGTLQDVSEDRKVSLEREAMIEKLQASLLFLHEPLSNLGHDALVCDLNMTVTEVAHLMSERCVTAALVSSGSAFIGIVTDHDLRERVLAGSTPMDAPIHTIMSAPISRILEDAPIYEALMRMEEKDVRHLAVEDHEGQIVNVVDSKSLIQFQRYGSVVLLREISRASSPEKIALLAHRAPILAKALLNSSSRPRYVTRMISSVCDSVTERLIQLAIETLGDPPADFAFVAMGSHGRQEQTLVSDQDNGIIFLPRSGSDQRSSPEYFLRLGNFVSEGLTAAGFPLCAGGVMASQPRWCREINEWKSGFDNWIRKSEPQEIIDFSISLDFRTVYGNSEMLNELRQSIYATLENQPAFLNHVALNALTFKPPFRLLGNIYLSGGATEHSGEINLKDAMLPIVSFARLYALRHHAALTPTTERIDFLAENGVISPSSRDEIVAAYDFLMLLRLQIQMDQLQAGRNLTNTIHPSKLSYFQKELLKQAFTQISAVQQKIRYDFLGGG
jgi:PAS domain S-box-containing protein